MFSTYSTLFRAPGSAAFSGAGFLARMPMSMIGIGTILMVSGSTGTYAIAGVLSGAMVLAGSVTMPQIARLIDRLGQGRVLRPTLLVHGLSLAALIAAVRLEWPVWSWFATGVVAGATLPSIGSMVRARWAQAIQDTERRQTAFAFESVVDEVVFVIGPPLATFLATSVRPEAGLAVALCFAIGGGLYFSSLRTTEPPIQRDGPRVSRREVMTRGLLAVCVTFVGAGAVFGSVEVVVVAFADERGQRGLAGVVLACYAAGSLIAGLVYGAVRWRGRHSDRFVLAAVFFGVATALPLLADSVLALSPLIFLTGLAIAPVLIGGMTLVERLVPRSALTEGLTWAVTALTLGVTAGAAIAGPLVDAYDGSVAFRLPAGAALVTSIAAIATHRWLRAAQAAEPAQPVEPDLTGTAGADDLGTAGTDAASELESPVPATTVADAAAVGPGRMDP